MRVHPRLTLDIGWRDLLSALRPSGGTDLSVHAPPGRTLVVGLSVRTVWDALLAELDARPGDQVSATAVNIEGMFTIARERGFQLTPVDIDIRTLAASDDPPAPAARVHLHNHLFGAVTPFPSWDRDLLRVEDRAQAFAGALEVDPACDVTLYSFGPIKTATALGGAIGLFKDADLGARVRARLEAYPPLGDGWFLRRVLKYAGLKLLSTPVLYGLLLRGLRASGRDPEAAIAGAVRGFGAEVDLARIRRRPPPRLAALLHRRLSGAPAQTARRARALTVLNACGHSWPGADAPHHSFWLAPIISRDPDGLAVRLRRAGFDATRGATSLRALDGAPRARRLLDEALYLPLSPRMPPRTLARLAALLSLEARPR